MVDMLIMLLQNCWILATQAHIEECPNASVSCGLNCGLCIRRGELESHIKSCPKRLVGCSYCGEDLPWESLEVRGEGKGKREGVL